MNIKQDVRIHNKFDIEVIDVRTGEVRQRAKAFNVVLDQFFTTHMSRGNAYHAGFKSISMGKGSGIPSPSDTGLFSSVSSYTATRSAHGANADEGYYYATYKATMTTEQGNGYTYTEIGLWYTTGEYASAKGCLATHAMLVDSEGNPMSIKKTDTDVIYITATVYCYVDSTADGVTVPVANNTVARWIFGITENLSTDVSLSPSEDTLVSQLTAHTPVSLSAGMSASSDGKTLTLNEVSFTTTTTGAHPLLIRKIGVNNCFMANLPNHNIFPPYPIIGKVLGTGDGVTKEFSTGAPVIMEGSETIYKNGVALTRDVDYVINYDSNCTGEKFLYHTAFLNVSENAEFGTYRNFTYSSFANYYYQPYSIISNSNTSTYTSYYVSSAKPAKLNFGTKKKCNTLKLEQTLASGYLEEGWLDDLYMAYSDDGETYTEVTFVKRTDLEWFWEPVSAQYWKFYFKNHTWKIQTSTAGSTPTPYSGRGHVFLGFKLPGLVFTEAPAEGDVISADYSIDIPYKTANNILRASFTINLQGNV